MLKTIFFEPMYNALVFLVNLVPGGDIGFSIILLTILVKLILLPMYQQSLKTQKKIKEIEPEINQLKQTYGQDRQTLALKTMEIYQKNNIKPLSGVLVIFIQIPIILTLFFVFRQPITENYDSLYSFLSQPTELNNLFLGFFDMSGRSYLIALLAGLTQFWQTHLSLPPLPPKTSTEISFKQELAKSMNFQMKYFMPVLTVMIAVGLPSAVGLYWLTSNLFAVMVDLLIKKQIFNQPKV